MRKRPGSVVPPRAVSLFYMLDQIAVYIFPQPGLILFLGLIFAYRVRCGKAGSQVGAGWSGKTNPYEWLKPGAWRKRHASSEPKRRGFRPTRKLVQHPHPCERLAKSACHFSIKRRRPGSKFQFSISSEVNQRISLLSELVRLSACSGAIRTYRTS
jgi:hypothetical protein